MIRVKVGYPNLEDHRFDHVCDHAHHRQLLSGRLTADRLQRVEMDKALADGAGGKAPVTAVAHLIFNDPAGFQSGIRGHGREIMADVANYTGGAPATLISEMAA